LRLPSVKLSIEDARSWLRRTERRWDVIISEPSNPWVAGNASLFTCEFFDLVRSRLEPGGLLAQWFHVYEMDDEMLKLVLRTVRSRFAKVSLWELFPEDLLLVASDTDVGTDLEGLSRRMARSPIRADLARVGVESTAGLLALQLLAPPGLDQRLQRSGALHRDDRPVLEFRGARALFRGDKAVWVDQVDDRRWPPAATDLLLYRWLTVQPMTAPQGASLFRFFSRFPSAPDRLRSGLVDVFRDEIDLVFLCDVLFTLVRDDMLKSADRVASRLLTEASTEPRALYAVALLRDAQANGIKGPGVALMRLTERHLLLRCVALGDTGGRCARTLEVRRR
jgi:hypothetical protein